MSSKDTFKSSNGKFKEAMRNTLGMLQNLGKTLQFPIAVLPFAAILNRFGALGIAYTADPTTGAITNEAGWWISTIIQTPGAMVFANLPLFFAIGCGFGLSKDKRGEAALAAVAFYLVTTSFTAEHMLPSLIWDNLPKPDINAGQTSNAFWFSSTQIVNGETQTLLWSKLYYLPVYDATGEVITGSKYVLDIGVIGGIVAGCMTAYLYNHFKDLRIPKSLAFFGGRRFIPMLAISAAVPFSFGYAIIWPWIQLGLTTFGTWVSGTSSVAILGAFFYGFINRMTQPFGMHQILNTFLWFQLPVSGVKIEPGSGLVAAGGQVFTVNGDINAFTAGIWGSGTFQGIFFPMFLGGLPAITVAMILTAKKENRQSVATFFAGVAFVTFLTGIDEPVVFSFVFIAPLLLVIHAIFTGLLCALTLSFHIHLGFGFSAGFIDYCISLPQGWGFSKYEGVVHGTAYGVMSNPLWVLPLAVLAFGMYFPTFYFLIKKLDVKTPGREDDYIAVAPKEKTTKTNKSGKKAAEEAEYQRKAEMIVEAIGVENFSEQVDNCATRLRITVKDSSGIDTKKIKESGAFGTKVISKTKVQIVIGVDVEHVCDKMNAIINKG